MSSRVVVLLVLLAALACGRYGPPQRSLPAGPPAVEAAEPGAGEAAEEPARVPGDEESGEEPTEPVP